MQESLPDGFKVRLGERSGPGAILPPSSNSALQVLNILFLMPGLFLSFLALGKYPPLDKRLPMGILLSIFLLPVLLHMASFAFKRTSQGGGPWPKIYRSAAVAMVLLGIVLLMNGGLDRYPGNEVSVKVLRKSAMPGRRTTDYILTVASWNSGGGTERLSVGGKEYACAVVGKTVFMLLHKGYFGLVWRGLISAP